MTEKIVEISNKTGLHARPAALFVQTAARYKSSIWVEKEGRRVNGKSIMGLMSMAISKGVKIKLLAEGEDEMAAIDDLRALLEERLMCEYK